MSEIGMTSRARTLAREKDHWAGRFSAMASPCEILLDNVSHREAEELLQTAYEEAMRIERKFSRYRSDSVVQHINMAGGDAVEVDEETAKLLDYAQTCWTISNGLFDVTSGVLRRAWKFDGSDRLPTAGQVRELLPLI